MNDANSDREYGDFNYGYYNPKVINYWDRKSKAISTYECKASGRGCSFYKSAVRR